MQRARLDLAVFFGENSRNLVHWSNSRGSALTTSVLALSRQKPSTSAKRRVSPLDCESPERAPVSRFLFLSATLSVRTCGNLED